MSVSIDQQFVEFVVKALVSNPDAVSVNRTIDEKGVLLELTVDPEDLGRVIGKRGGTAQSIRTLLRALGTKNEARYNLKIVDTDGGSGATQTRQQDDNPQDTQDDYVQTDAPADDTTSVDEPADNPVEEAVPESVENETSEYEEKHRKDLADLDDLDI
jgi:predicted RNA-binding protein YlqC (UPF0109 family)